MQYLAENIVQNFTPLPKQKLFLYRALYDNNAKFIWYCGGFGSGKSYIGSQTVIRLAMMAPRGRTLIARQTLVDLKATTMKTFFEVIDRRLILKWNKSENLVTLINGHEIYFWGLDDIEKLKSLEIGTFWIDEVNEVAEMTFNVLKGRLRHKAHPKRLGLLTSNSEGKNWTYKQFVLGKGIRTQEDLEKYFIIKAPSTENTNLPEDYLEVLNSYTGDLYERYVKASFNVFEGQIYTDFNREIHCIPPFAIPKEWKRLRVLDHGERNPTACLWGAIDPKTKFIYFYREYYKAGEFVDYHSKEISELSREENIDHLIIDPSTKSTRGKSGKKIDQEYKEEFKKLTGRTLRIIYANNDVSAGIARVHKYLRIDQSLTHPVTGEQGAPRLYFFNTLTNTIDEMEGYKWKKISSSNENDPDEAPRKRDDHAVDCVRYGIMERPDINFGYVSKKITQVIKDNDPYKQAIPLTAEEQLLANALKNNPKDFL